MSLRLGFHYHTPARRDAAGTIHIASYMGVFVDSLASQCEQVVCFFHSPLPAEESALNYTIQQPNVTLVDIGPHVSIPRRMLNASRFVRPLSEWHDQLDAMLLRGPSPLLSAMANAAGDIPVALLLVGDYLAEARAQSDRFMPGKIARRLWLEWNYRQQARVVHKHLTLVNSRQLYQDFQPIAARIFETKTTTLSTSDFYYRDDTCIEPPYHILYAGRISRSKGVMDILDAVLSLYDHGNGIDLVFDLVGWAEDGDTILTEIAETAASHGAADRVIYHGLKQVGEELFSYYRQSDLYVIASRSSFEGFPRTIWEALANSVPVIATAVGSIPLFLEDQQSVVLTEPNNIPMLRTAIQRVISDGVLRRRLIAQGREAVRENTLENRASEIVQRISEWIDQRERVQV